MANTFIQSSAVASAVDQLVSFVGLGPLGNYTFNAPDASTKLDFPLSEASGSVVDTTAAVTFPVHGTPTFSVTGAPPWGNVSPGITYGAGGNYHGVSSNVPRSDLGTGDGTFEWIASFTGTPSNRFVYQGFNVTSGYNLEISNSDTLGYFYFQATDSTVGLLTFNFNKVINDGGIHKFRLSVSRSASCQLFIDGVSQGTTASLLPGKTVTTDYGILGAGPGNPTNGTFYHFRFSNTASANMGPTNGLGGG